LFGHFQIHLLPPSIESFLSCYGENAIAEPTVVSVALRGVFCDPRRWIGAPWARPSIPNDLQFSRGCFDGSLGAALKGIGPGTTADGPKLPKIGRFPWRHPLLREHSLLGNFEITATLNNIAPDYGKIMSIASAT
jgi:hypothetical protein